MASEPEDDWGTTDPVTTEIDEAKFDAFQTYLAEMVALMVVAELEPLDLPRDRLEEVVYGVAFGMAAIMDASAMLELEGERIVPVLTFVKPGQPEVLIRAEGTSWMHEYMPAIVEGVMSGDMGE